METRWQTTSTDALDEAAVRLRSGEPVAVPTETVYGLAADATDDAAVRRIFAAKGRPADNPLIVHVGRACGSLAALREAGLVGEVEPGSRRAEVAERLIRAFWPGPLTLVLPRGARIAAAVAAGRPTVALRMPAHPTMLALLDRLPFPLAAPSANRSERVSPTTAAHVIAELGGRIPLVLDDGPSVVGVESTVVEVGERGTVRLLRPGGVPAEAIEAALGTEVAAATEATEAAGRALSPGQRPVHYAPETPLLVVPCGTSPSAALARLGVAKEAPLGLLLLASARPSETWSAALQGRPLEIRAVGDRGDGSAAARALFALLRELDAGPARAIVAELPEGEGGLWPAVRDRLRRAAARAGARG